jgi:hypothetical protein
MVLVRKVKRILAEAFPPPAKVRLKDEDGLVGVVTSPRFRNMDIMDRQELLDELLRRHGLSDAELRRILILVAVTPEEEEAHTAVD